MIFTGIFNSYNFYCILVMFMHSVIYVIYIEYRSTPVETLHTLLLGPYKYLLHTFMCHLTVKQKNQLQACLLSFDFSGLDYKLSYSIIRHFRSFVGRHFKALAQVALFLLGPFMTPAEKEVWLSLSKVLNDIISFFPFNIIYGVLATIELIMYYNNQSVLCIY